MKKYLLILALATGCTGGIHNTKMKVIKPMDYSVMSSNIGNAKPITVTDDVKQSKYKLKKPVYQKGAEQLISVPKETIELKEGSVVPVTTPLIVKIKWVNILVYYFTTVVTAASGWFIWKEMKRRSDQKKKDLIDKSLVK